MGAISFLEKIVLKWRAHVRLTQQGPLGDFWRHGGNELLADALPLRPDDVVIDGGGFKGEWADQIMCRYGSHLVIFEPVPDFFQILHDRYRFNNRIDIHCAALSNAAGKTTFSISGDGSSIFGKGVDRIEVSLESLSEFIFNSNFINVGCLKLNIEGSEYEVLEDILDKGLAPKLRCILVQFHRMDNDSEQRRKRIQERLTSTHTKVFDYPFIWERWDLAASDKSSD